MLRSLLFSILCFMTGFLCAMVLAEIVGGGRAGTIWFIEPAALCGGFAGLALGLVLERPQSVSVANASARKSRSRRFYILTILISFGLLAAIERAKISFVGWPWINRIGDAGRPVYGRNGPWLLVTLIEFFTILMILQTVRSAPKKRKPRKFEETNSSAILISQDAVPEAEDSTTNPSHTG